MKRIIASPDAPAAVGPYSQAVELNGTLYVSGQLPVDTATGGIPDSMALAKSLFVNRLLPASKSNWVFSRWAMTPRQNICVMGPNISNGERVFSSPQQARRKFSKWLKDKIVSKAISVRAVAPMMLRAFHPDSPPKCPGRLAMISF